MLSKIKKMVLLAPFALLVNCGGGSIIERWDTAINDDSFSMYVKLADSIELESDLRVAYKNFGEIWGETDASGQYLVGVDLSLDLLKDQSLSRVTELPSGHSFPRFIRSVPMLHTVVLKKDKLLVHLYAGTFGDKKVVGVGLQLKGEGMGISGVGSYLHRVNDQIFGSVTLDGPSTNDDGQGGGLYIFADLGVLLSKGQKTLTIQPTNTKFDEVSGIDKEYIRTEKGYQQFLYQFGSHVKHNLHR